MEHSIVLVCHPSTSSNAARAITGLVRRSVSGTLEFTFRLVGDVAQVRVPAPCAPRSAAGLWHHTCFEAFIAIEGQAEYHEYNFSPSGEWAVHAFRGYRDGGPLGDETLAPSVTVRAVDDGLELGAVVELGHLSPLHPHTPLRIALAAVIEARDGTHSYWALRHRAEKPDFHDPASFALRLESPVP
jgi:hypothetical protein